MNLEGIKAILAAQKPILAERFKVREIGIFGSCVRGEMRDDSDLDVLVSFSEPIGFFAFLDLEEYLGSLLGRRVDLVSKRALKKHIGRNIMRELVTI